MRSPAKLTNIEFQLTRAFTPATPVACQNFLHGRAELLANIRRAWAREGASVGLYGPRGVGKTSVVKMASSVFRGHVFYHSASAGDSFESIALDMLHYFHRSADPGSESPSRIPERAITPQSVAQSLPASPTLLIIDDLERIQDKLTRCAFADLIKKISDVRVPARLTFVGIGDHIRELIEDHRSVSRQIVAMEVPELSSGDIHGIIRRGAKLLGIGFDQEAADQIEQLSENMPYRAHLLCEGAVHCLLDALQHGMKSEYVVSVAEVRAALEYARKSGQYPRLPDRPLVEEWGRDRDIHGHGSEFSRTPHREIPRVPSFPPSSSAVTK